MRFDATPIETAQDTILVLDRAGTVLYFLTHTKYGVVFPLFLSEILQHGEANARSTDVIVVGGEDCGAGDVGPANQYLIILRSGIYHSPTSLYKNTSSQSTAVSSTSNKKIFR